jgi:DNA-binding transcriptional MerR regulator
MVVAWRICHLVKLGREVPHLPASVYFQEAEWKALMIYHTHDPLPAEPPTLGRAIKMIAKLGGFRGRKSDGEPGAEVMWRGIQRHDDITEAWRQMAPRYEQLQECNQQLQENNEQLQENNEQLQENNEQLQERNQQLHKRNDELTEALRVAMARGP